ncbi:MAG: hypothetical protein ACRDLQ_09670 [Solirubrobacterales bacterium]
MEAVRNLQAIDEKANGALAPAGRAVIETRGDEVLIDGLAVNDRTLVELIERRIERDIAAAETVTDALAIGARVLDREATGAEVEAVRHELERAAAEAERSFADRARSIEEGLVKQFERFLGEDGGAMSKLLDSQAGEFTELVTRHFGLDRNTAVQHQVKELVAKSLSDSRQDLLRQFSAQDGHNPLADFKASIVREVKRSGAAHERLIEKLAQLEGEVKRLHDAREAQLELSAERERGTGKGREFEQHAFELVEQLAGGRGDVAHHVGDERSASGGKKGDIVIEIDAASGAARGRIAIDAKDERLSKNAAWAVLNAALDERDAGFAILLVASDEKVPSGREQLHEYEGNKMIVALDKETMDPAALELAYRYARCRCLMAQEKGLEVDAAGVRDAADEALSALRDAQRIRSSLTGATNSVDSARKALDGMVARVEAALVRVETLIS